MTDTYINWNPSPQLVKTAKRYYDYHFNMGLTYKQIWLRVHKKHNAIYIGRLANWYKNHYVLGDK